MNGLFDNRNMAIVYHECIWAFSIFSLFLLVSFRVLFHERNQVGDKNPDLFSCRTTGRRVAVNGGGIKATGQSYAPYSKFHVGAAALLEDGTIITGSNQENAAYPSGLCAERVALFHAGHQYPDMPVVALAIAAATNGRQVESISPCGACRQVLLEAEQRYGKPMKVLLCGTKEVVVAESAESLLPLCFGRKI